MIVELNTGTKSTVELIHYQSRDIAGCEMHIADINGLCAMLGYFVQNILDYGYLQLPDIYHIISVAARESEVNNA